MNAARHIAPGLWREMPVLRLGVGLCPALAVSGTLKNGVGMGLATLSVLAASTCLAEALGRVVPERARFYCRVAVVAGLVTAVDGVLARRAAQLRADLGIFVPLIAVSCLVLGGPVARSGRSWARAILGDLGRGLGFVIALAVLSAVRELAGVGALWGRQVLGESAGPVAFAALPAGAFLAAGLLAGLVALAQARRPGRV